MPPVLIFGAGGLTIIMSMCRMFVFVRTHEFFFPIPQKISFKVYINLNHLGTYQELNLNSVLRDVGTTSVSPGSGGYSSGPGLGTGFNPAVNWGNGSFSSGGYLYGAQTSQFSSYHSTSSGGGGQHHDSTYDGGGWAWGGAGRRF